MLKPNFFIIGAPKCGTTALSEYLRSHAEIFVSTPKEPHFFATDMPKYRTVKNTEEYLDLFKLATKNHNAIGEASVWYLYSNEAIKNIHEFNPNSKLIVMLRNPVELIYSMHSQALASLEESVKDFSKAWNLSKQRKEGNTVPENCRDRKILYYDEIAKLGSQLEQVLKIFPPKQVHIIFFEDFSKNTRHVYRRVLDFLEVKDNGKQNFPIVNKNEKIKSSTLFSIICKMPKNLTSFYLKIKRSTGFKGIRLVDRLNNWNLFASERTPLDQEIKEQIIMSYKDDITKLSLLTGRDLSEWLQY